MRILMVCLGNICRSPIAEGVLRHKLKQHGLAWTVDSAGTESSHVGQSPHRFSQQVCQSHGIDISGLTARQFNIHDFTNYDKIYAFASDVYREIEHIGGTFADMHKVDYFLNELNGKENASVPDPYFGAADGYRIVYELIDKTCDAIINNYKHNNPSR